MSDPYRRLLVRSLLAAGIGAASVAICYFWVDPPVAFYVHDHALNTRRVFRWLTYPPPVVQTWSPLVLAVLVVRRAFGAWTRWQLALAVACVSLVVADQFRESLGDLCGRYWPETWHDNNPSLIGTGTYGFHPFVAGDDTGSFPSGHAARIAAFAGVWWLALPRGRLLYALVSLPLLASLVLMNYHFVGDVAAGAILGFLVAAWFDRLTGLDQPTALEVRHPRA